jgi:hypothetical protein
VSLDVNWPSDGATPGSAIGTGPVFFAATSTAAALHSAAFFAAPELHLATVANDHHFTGAAFQIAVDPPFISRVRSLSRTTSTQGAGTNGVGSSRPKPSPLSHGIQTTSGTRTPNEGRRQPDIAATCPICSDT